MLFAVGWDGVLFAAVAWTWKKCQVLTIVPEILVTVLYLLDKLWKCSA